MDLIIPVSLAYLDCGDTGESPKVTIAYPRELVFDLLKHSSCNVQASISAMEGLGFEAHSSVVAVNRVLRYIFPGGGWS